MAASEIMIVAWMVGSWEFAGKINWIVTLGWWVTLKTSANQLYIVLSIYFSFISW